MKKKIILSMVLTAFFSWVAKKQNYKPMVPTVSFMNKMTVKRLTLVCFGFFPAMMGKIALVVQ